MGLLRRRKRKGLRERISSRKEKKSDYISHLILAYIYIYISIYIHMHLHYIYNCIRTHRYPYDIYYCGYVRVMMILLTIILK